MLEAISLTRTNQEKRLLDRVSLSVQPATRAAIVGPSGSGKTVLLRALALLDPMDSGEVRWHDERIVGPRIPWYRSRVVYLSQRASLIEGTIEENLRSPFALKIHQDKAFDRKRIVHMLELLARSPAFLNQQQRDLSGGESQIVALLRSLQLDPEMMLLDEPTSALDSATAKQVEDLITQWLDEDSGRSVIWITHNLPQARRVAERFWRIENGALTETTLTNGAKDGAVR